MASIFPAGITFTMETSFDLDAIAAYFTRIEGELLCYASSGDELVVPAGLLEFYIIDISGALGRGHELFDLFDQSQEAFECYELLFDPASGELHEKFLDEFEAASGMNILLLHRLEVLPAFRNSRIGLAAISRAIDLFGGCCGYAVLKAMPLQFESRDSTDRQQWYAEMKMAEFSGDETVSGSRLQAHYARLGFRSIAGTPWMALNLDYERPAIQELAFGR